MVAERQGLPDLVGGGGQVVELAHVGGRHDLVLLAAEEEDGDLCDGGNDGVAGPHLVAEQGEVAGGREDLGDELAHAEKGVLEHEAGNVAVLLVVGDEADGHGAAEALAVDDVAMGAGLGAVAQVVDGGLGVEDQSGLARLTRGAAVAAVLEHEDVAADHVAQHARNGQPVADVARVAVEHDHGHLGVFSAARAADVEGGQLLAIVRRDDQLLKVGEAKLVWPWNVGAGISGNV